MRTLTPTVEAALESGEMRLLVFVEMLFDGQPLRVNNSTINLDWNGYTWTGVGKAGSINPISESSSLEALGIRFEISGIQPELISTALLTHYQGRRCTLWIAPLTRGHAVIDDPIPVFWGRLDVMDLKLGETATITVSAESRLADWNRPKTRRYNHEDQQIDYPGDKGFEYVAQMVDKTIIWGA